MQSVTSLFFVHLNTNLISPNGTQEARAGRLVNENLIATFGFKQSQLLVNLFLLSCFSTNLNSPNGTQEARAGTFVNENLIAVYHDHFFNFRLDLDVDGQDNSYVIRQHQRLVNRDQPTPRQSYWTVSGCALQCPFSRLSKMAKDVL